MLLNKKKKHIILNDQKIAALNAMFYIAPTYLLCSISTDRCQIACLNLHAYNKKESDLLNRARESLSPQLNKYRHKYFSVELPSHDREVGLIGGGLTIKNK